VRRITAVSALLRRLRDERVVVTFLFAIVAITSFAVAAAPRLFDRVSDDGLRYEANAATVVQRNIEFTTVDRIPAPDDAPVSRVVARGDALWDRVPGPIQDLVADRRFVIDSTRFRVPDPPNYTTFVTFRYQDGLDGRITFVDGRAPARLPAPAPGDPPRLEMALSTEAAAETQIRVGDTYTMVVDPADPTLRNVFPRPSGTVDVVVVGLFQVVDPTADYWFADPRLVRATIGGTDDNPIAYTTGLIAPEAYPDVLGLELPITYRWRLSTDSARLDAGQVPALASDLRRLKTAFETQGAVDTSLVTMRTGLDGVVDRFLAQQATAEGALAVAALGPLAVAVGAIALVAALIIRRRRAAIVLARGRGASMGQLMGAQLIEGLLVTMPAALVGWLAAVLVVPSRTNAASLAGALVVSLAATGLMCLATWPLAHRSRRVLERDDRPVTRLSPRRLVLELLVIGLAVAGVWLLRQRGLGAAGATGDPTGFDPFLALSPVLVGLAVGLVTLRLYPIPIRGLGWLAARRRDLVAVLGLRSIGRNPSAAYLPLLVLMLTVAIGTFTAVVRVTVERGQVAASWQALGADYRIASGNGGSLGPRVDASVVPGVEAVAAGYSTGTVGIRAGSGRPSSTILLAVDPIAYEGVVAGSPAAIALPPSLRDAPTGPDVGSPDSPIPAIVSEQAPIGTAPLAVGDTFELSVRGTRATYRVDGLAAGFPGLPAGSSFAVVPLQSLASIVAGGVRPTVEFVRGGASIGPALAAAIAEQSASATVDSRHERYAAMHDAPFVSGVVAGFGLTLGIAVVYAALAVIAVVLLNAQRRSRDIGFLRTLGVTDPQVAGLSVVEHGLPVLVAVVVGTVLGLGVAWLLEPGLGLAAFIGPGAVVDLQVDWASVVGVALVVVAVVVVAMVASAWLARRLDLGRVMRIGEE
jgi:putative ABC transport system permease protein